MSLLVVPPALSLALAVWLAIAAFRAPRTRDTGLQDFALFILLVIYYARSTLSMVLTDTAALLAIARATQLAYVFVSPVVVDLALELSGKRSRRAMLAFYLVCIPLSLAFLTPLGFSAMAFNGYGYQVVLGPIGRVYALLVSICFLFAIVTLLLATRRWPSGEPYRRKLFAMAAMLALSGALLIFAAAGLHIYPPGNFGFLALAVWAFAVARFGVQRLSPPAA